MLISNVFQKPFAVQTHTLVYKLRIMYWYLFLLKPYILNNVSHIQFSGFAFAYYQVCDTNKPETV